MPGSANRTLILSDLDVTRLLPMAACIDVMEHALRALAAGDAVLPLRTVLRLPGSSDAFALMPSLLTTGTDHAKRTSALGAKVITVFPGNDLTPLDSHIGVVLLFDGQQGRLRAIMDASSITAIRTAAVSGLATRLLARPDATDLAILGSGAQAMTHLDAMRCVRNVQRVRVWSRTPSRAARFAARASARFQCPVEPCFTAREAVTDAHIVCTVTSAREPVLEGEWIAPGTHINAVGASFSTTRELDTAAVRRAVVYVDRVESALAEAGDLLIPIVEGAIERDHIRGEIGALLRGDVAGPDAADDVTLFKSLGLAVEDLAAAQYLYARALATETGTSVFIGGVRHDM
ncbi:MAG: Delta(1)-pyrroline-2-carboxylate reductase [Gemmatimonadaceae bacterium]|nr:Delta(1)-pyrroline-2-carboxylate reductase [Gemmatimonadaceae bacterium]